MSRPGPEYQPIDPMQWHKEIGIAGQNIHRTQVRVDDLRAGLIAGTVTPEEYKGAFDEITLAVRELLEVFTFRGDPEHRFPEEDRGWIKELRRNFHLPDIDTSNSV